MVECRILRRLSDDDQNGNFSFLFILNFWERVNGGYNIYLLYDICCDMVITQEKL